MAIVVNSQFVALTRQKANEILMLAYGLVRREPHLRLGQAICVVGGDYVPNPFPELFHEECPIKVGELFYQLVENEGKR